MNDDELEIIKNKCGGRNAKIYMLRTNGATLKDISKIMKCSQSRVSQIFLSCKKKLERYSEHPFNELSDRSKNCLIADGITTIKQLKIAYKKGRVTQITSTKGRVELIGMASFREIESFLKSHDKTLI